MGGKSIKVLFEVKERLERFCIMYLPQRCGEYMANRTTEGKIRRRSTIVDVAREAEVSYGVAADILRASPRYSYRDETVSRVQQAAQELGYRPNRMAQAMITGRTHQIALSLTSFGPSFINKFVRAFDYLIRDTPYDLLVTSHQALKHQDITADGLIYYGVPGKIQVASSLPTVALGIYYGKKEVDAIQHDAVLMNMTRACNGAMKHFLEQKYKRILFVADESMMQLWEPRYKAYCKAMKAAHLPCETLAFTFPTEQHLRNDVKDLLQKYFSQNGFPDAIFCSNDDVAMGAYRALRQLGRAIPQETAVLGCDDIEESQDLTPALSSIHIPVEEMTKRAWELLMRRMKNPELPWQHIRAEAQLILRQSSLRTVR
jgi:LacI family transcriptional regulator